MAKPGWWLLGLAAGLLVGLVLGAAGNPARAAVTLTYFRATPLTGKVLIEWGTASEMDISGFYVNRSTQPDHDYDRVSPFQPATGDLIGVDYSYSDPSIPASGRYWYRLEIVSSSQNLEYSDSISTTVTVTHVAASPTPTLTATSTSTPTPTVTQANGGGSSPTATSTPTPTLTPTASPALTFTRQPTATRAPTSTLRPAATTAVSPPDSAISPTASPAAPPDPTLTLQPATVLPTATLVPFPTITLVFPATSTHVPGLLAFEQPDDPAPGSKNEPSTRGNNLSRLWPLGLLLFLWVILGAVFWFAQRSLHE